MWSAEAADAVDEKRKKRPRRIVPGERLPLRRPGGAMMCGGVGECNVSLTCRRGRVVVGCASRGRSRVCIRVASLDRRKEKDWESIPRKSGVNEVSVETVFLLVV